MYQFRSRVSVVLVIFIVGCIIPAFFLGEPNTSAFIAYGILGLTVVGLLAILFGTRYEITETQLKIKIGPFNYGEIELRTIEKVERSYNPLSSPSASLKRLHIKAEGNGSFISPVNEEEFIRILKSRNPKIKFHIEDSNVWWHFWNWDV